jgi:two-component system chemotaxis sensor kinase CheA
MDHMAAIRVTFFQECDDQLAALEQGLMTMEEGDTSSDTVNAVFRAVHSIKGGAGAFQLDQLVSFAHVFETALDRVRSGALVPDPDAMKLFLRAADALADLVADSREGNAIDDARYGPIRDEFAALNGGARGEQADDYADIDFAPVVIAIDGPAEGQPPEAHHRITFRPHASLFAKANEPIALFRALAELGRLDAQCDAAALPALEAMDPDGSYLSWDLTLAGEAGEAAIREVFEFVDGDCDLTITGEGAPSAAAPPADLDVQTLLAKVKEEAPQFPEAVKAAEPEAPAAGKASTRTVTQPTIRVELDRVDRLINLVGELVINQAMLSQRVYKSGHTRDTQVAASLDELEQLTRELQESVMAIRAQPVKPLFQRMSRIVREVADATGKEVRLRTEGESTEVDKTVVELLADPLTHMIRNAVDHGLERPEEREAKGKAAEGIVRLSAAHRSGRVVIEVADDGAGINRARVLEKAISKGLVAADAQLTESEIDNLLFLPGFSTAAAVSNISGRGVGMDVVKRSIQALGGRIAISSRPNQGSTFTMSLPLTLAVLDGIVVSVDDQTYVIPLTTIVETLQPEAARMHAMGDGAFVMRIRDSFVPLIDVGVELGVRPVLAAPRNGVAILVESENGSRNALLVDGIQDQRQVVIKSLETNYARVHGIAAATILGDGRVAMILDVDGLVRGHKVERVTAENPLAMAS